MGVPSPAHIEYRVGDELVVWCDPEDARVADVRGGYVYIEWPWREVDLSSNKRWNGQLAFPRDPDSLEWANTPWRLDPDPSELEVGETCQVGIPRTAITVRSVRFYDPPRDLGWLPRPTIGLGVANVADARFGDEAGYVIYVDGAEPISLERAE